MTIRLDEVSFLPAEAAAGEELRLTPEAAAAPAEQIFPEEDRTFAVDKDVPQNDTKPKKSKKKRLTVAAAIFAAAGISLFAGFADTAELLHTTGSTPTTVATQTAETTEETSENEAPQETQPSGFSN